MADTRACPRCGGCGAVPLSTELQATLDELRRYGEATPRGLQKAFPGVSAPALCNRLADLAALGYATVRRDGAFAWYRAVRGRRG